MRRDPGLPEVRRFVHVRVGVDDGTRDIGELTECCAHMFPYGSPCMRLTRTASWVGSDRVSNASARSRLSSVNTSPNRALVGYAPELSNSPVLRMDCAVEPAPPTTVRPLSGTRSEINDTGVMFLRPAHNTRPPCRTNSRQAPTGAAASVRSTVTSAILPPVI